jgi:hypothetical protein
MQRISIDMVNNGDYPFKKIPYKIFNRNETNPDVLTAWVESLLGEESC